MRKLNIVLFEPEIAANVGAIMRTCALINAKLHLIEPFGFIFDKRNFTRTSANNFEGCEFQRYDDLNSFFDSIKPLNCYFLTRYGKKPLSDFNFKNIDNDVYLFFGKESTGLPLSLLKDNKSFCFRFPMVPTGRSLNIANCVGIASYEVLRQWDYLDLSFEEVEKGSDYLDR
ncbi:tRNA (cytidine(34)-2'-O)-methyltransferase [Spiroplasma turonicum]|uniref:Putative tRNA (cytidine(34)-2'-O)-methyltransferase n=1 Tax=Spiroplasma turonicum TaxID=216946 RepID=A0A0K1P5L4_9MOLU|nr:tRNA (cytidine(34)-2'-O)-methyltransferase [Spiroplasma turonicum]AKU79593.1 RNA methyltransferase [Spiroplasma turonicum]ALX70615.1 RNA methyltransferase [Spiroplasma turonicum]